MSGRPRVDLVAPPMSGHLHPVLGIAAALGEVYDVRVVSSPRGTAQARDSGLRTADVLVGRDDDIREIVDPAQRIGSNPVRLIRQFTETLDLQADLLADLRPVLAADRPGLVIADFTVPAAGTACRDLGLPWWTSHPSPCVIEGRSGPPAYLGGLTPGAGRTGQVRDAAARLVTRSFKEVAAALARPRLARLGHSRPYRADGSECAYSGEQILALMPERLEFPRDLPDTVDLVGLIGFTPPHDGPPPPWVAGRRHVLVTSGTHLPWHKAQLVASATRVAVALPQVEVHVSLGGQAAPPHRTLAQHARRTPRHEPRHEPRPANLTVLDYVSYGRDLGGYDLVAHHAGAGILSHCLLRGIPSVVTPVDFDQPDYATRMVTAGVALASTHADLPRAVAEALDRADLRTEASRFADEARDYPAGRRIRELVDAHFTKAHGAGRFVKGSTSTTSSAEGEQGDRGTGRH